MQIQTVTRVILGVALTGALATPAVAQTPAKPTTAPAAVGTMANDEPLVDISAGYLYTRIIASNGGTSVNIPKGFFFGVDSTGMLGIAADVSGAFKSGSKSWAFTGGPKISSRGDSMKAFAQVLFGLDRQTGAGTGATSTNAFRIAPGGGVELKNSGKIGIVAKAAYTLDRANVNGTTAWGKGFELGVGILFGAGK